MGIIVAVSLAVAIASLTQHLAWGARSATHGVASSPRDAQHRGSPGTGEKRTRSSRLDNGLGALRLGSSWTEAGGYNRYSQLIVIR